MSLIVLRTPHQAREAKLTTHVYGTLHELLWVGLQLTCNALHSDDRSKAIKGAPDPVAREVYRGLLCLRKILQKPTDSVPQQDCETKY